MKISIFRFISKNLVFITLLIIISLGLFMRSYRLSVNPVALFVDEASIGYNGYTILSSGKSEAGDLMPIFFYSLEDFRLPISIYSTVPFIAMLGLNEVAVRLPSVLYGVLTIFFLYFIGKEIKSKLFGLLAAFIGTTMPWLFHYSRTGFEYTSYVAFFSLTWLLLFKSLHNNKFIYPAFLVAAITLYTYHPAKLVMPLFLLGFFIIYRQTYYRAKKTILIGLLIFIVISLPIIISISNGKGMSRFNTISVFSKNLTPYEKVKKTAYNYFIQLSPVYFLKGEPSTHTRHFINGLLPILIVTLPFLLVGIINIILTINKPLSQLLAYLVFLYPLGGAVIIGGPFTSRSVIGASLFVVIISIGLSTTAHLINRFIAKPVFIVVTTLLILFNFGLFLNYYFVLYPFKSADFQGWQYGTKDIVNYFSSHQKSYEDLIMTPEFYFPEIFFKFYAPNNCSKCKVGLPDKYFNQRRKQLYALTPFYLKNRTEFNYKPVKIIYYPDGQEAYILTELKK
ncbi:hypothetical protein A3A74_02255 [Candidatus Roizmanbacteria bacterium RIFCSPLOWO2_01_FULL_35_13]|uniref:Glycosyltransferase RgtA/B/C/D-like domain-containing protein n=1 Tax=Candidatus Roizmanbacteria bacterium RIFCSPLOWO2_01_FULL_35_13 TaxID=1802055 RepID=A0A1F7ICR7_9BACT|nr:MAG: hypothetical protein A3A74_02255 [Candidatus Roizmanbacteria bacterium RIFCSPLOWO2_01_FULL_35_13]